MCERRQAANPVRRLLQKSNGDGLNQGIEKGRVLRDISELTSHRLVGVIQLCQAQDH